MKKIVITSLILLLTPFASKALTVNTFEVGGIKHYSFSDGVRGTSYTVGGLTNYSFDNGITGTSYKVGGVTNYDFSISGLKKSYKLGDGNAASVNVYTPGEYYSTDGPKLISNACKGLNVSSYPDWIKRGLELSTKCLGEENSKKLDSSFSGYSNSISKCMHEGPERALNEILSICSKKQAELYIDRVKLVNQKERDNRIKTINVYSDAKKKKLLVKNTYDDLGKPIKQKSVYIDWSKNDLKDISGFYVYLGKDITLSNELSQYTYTEKNGFTFKDLKKGNYNLYFKLKYKDGYTSPVKYSFSLNIK